MIRKGDTVKLVHAGKEHTEGALTDDNTTYTHLLGEVGTVVRIDPPEDGDMRLARVRFRTETKTAFVWRLEKVDWTLRIEHRLVGAEPGDKVWHAEQEALETWPELWPATIEDVDAGLVTVRFANGGTGRYVPADLTTREPEPTPPAEPPVWSTYKTRARDSRTKVHVRALCVPAWVDLDTAERRTWQQVCALDAEGTPEEQGGKAEAWAAGAEATSEWMANNPTPTGPIDPPSNPYEVK